MSSEHFPRAPRPEPFSDPADSPWKTLSRESKYDNPWIHVSESQVINPNGGQGIYGLVHFKNFAVGALPLDDEGFTWLVGQYRYAVGRYSWEIPEGGGPLHIDPLETAKRELKEETGIEARDWTQLLVMHLSNSVTDEFGVVYLARGLTMGASQPDDDEALSLRRVPLDEAYALVEKGEITDSLSVAALTKVMLLRERGLLR